jgi:periplasmic protein TonB
MMEKGFLSVASLDEIVFEGRNRAYGAYVLRQEYPLQVVKATSISLITVFVFLIWLVGFGQNIPVPEDTKTNLPKERGHTLVPEPIIPEPLPIKSPNLQPTSPTAIIASKEFREIKVVPDLTPVVDNIPDQADFALGDPSLVTAAGELPGTVAPEEDAVNGLGNGPVAENNVPFEVVEKMPEFPDGQSAMYKFINKHLRYPSAAQSQGLEGNVILTFVVSATGEISDIKILQDIGGGAGEEARRVVAKMPRWRPGQQHQRAVPVRFTLPVRFRLN